MKKFLITCVSILCIITVAFMAIYFLSSKEVLTLKDSSWNNKSLIINKDYDIDFVLDNAESNTNESSFKANTTTEGVLSLKDNKPSVRDGSEKGQKIYTYKVTAQKAGSTDINVTFTPSGAEAITFTLHATVNDGTKEHPFPIFSSGDLQAIGQDDSVYTLDKHYKLQNDIVAEGKWSPIPGSFTGSLDGNNKTIKQIDFATSETEAVNAGIFNQIGETGSVYNLNIDQAKAQGNFANAGIVAVTNLGTIYGINVTGANIVNTNTNNSVNGGIVAINSNSDAMQYGKVTQSTFDGNISAKATSTIGGIVGINQGATVGYTYTTLNTNLNSEDSHDLTIGGIVGKNQAYQYRGGLVAESYSLASTNTAGATGSNIGGTIGYYDYVAGSGENKKAQEVCTYGCYYTVDKGFSSAIGNEEDLASGIVTDPTDAIQSHYADRNIYVAKGYSVDNLKVEANFASYTTEVDGAVQVVNYSFDTIWEKPTTENTPKLLKTSTVYVPTISNLLPSNNITNVLDLFRSSVIDASKATTYRITENLDADNITIYDDKILDKNGTQISTVNMFELNPSERITIKGIDNTITISNFNLVITDANTGFYNFINNSNIENITFVPNKVEVSESVNTLTDYNLGVVAGNIQNTILNGVKVNLTNTNFSVATTDTMNASNNTTYHIGMLTGTAVSSTIKSSQVISNTANQITLKFAASTHANNAYVGGIVGTQNNTQIIDNCLVDGLNIKNELNVKDGLNAQGATGGIAGNMTNKNANTDIANAIVRNTTILATEFAPSSNANIYGYYVGGIVGEIPASLYVENSNNVYGCQVVDTTLTGNIVGGIAGSTYGNIEKVYSKTTSTGWKVGGIAGYQLNYSKLANCLIEGTLNQATISANASYSCKIQNVENRCEVAGISAVATMLNAAKDDDASPVMDTCFINCAFNATNAYKDSASVKCPSDNTVYIFSNYSRGVPLINELKWNSDSYKIYPYTARTNNIIFKNVNNANVNDRPNISDAAGFFNDVSYDYKVTTLGDDYSVFDSFNNAIWNIDKDNKVVTIMF